jgi:hypothetical protein
LWVVPFGTRAQDGVYSIVKTVSQGEGSSLTWARLRAPVRSHGQEYELGLREPPKGRGRSPVHYITVSLSALSLWRHASFRLCRGLMQQVCQSLCILAAHEDLDVAIVPERECDSNAALDTPDPAVATISAVQILKLETGVVHHSS